MTVNMPSTICGDILAQHDRLRRQLHALDAVARRLLGADASSTFPLRRPLLATTRAVRDHLAFEERTLLPLLLGTEPCGRSRAQHLITEHTRQRAELTALEQEAKGDLTDGATLATQVRTLIAELLVDMHEEEADLMEAEAALGAARERLLISASA